MSVWHISHESVLFTVRQYRLAKIKLPSLWASAMCKPGLRAPLSQMPIMSALSCLVLQSHSGPFLSWCYAVCFILEWEGADWESKSESRRDKQKSDVIYNGYCKKKRTWILLKWYDKEKGGVKNCCKEKLHWRGINDIQPCRDQGKQMLRCTEVAAS